MQPDSTSRAQSQLSEAHTLLESLRRRLLSAEQKHPELEEAIEKLESALNLLTVQTGGML